MAEPQFLTLEEFLRLENFQTKIELNDARITELRQSDAQRALRSEMLMARIDALRLEVEALRLPDKKLYDQLVLRMAAGETLRNENLSFVTELKDKYSVSDDEEFGYDPDTRQVITRETPRRKIEDI